ncbi:xdhc- coxi [Lucifera butyrica]|uniref:Xdhc- coxi n=1 Tax=Lucifera butyrica TaxID=1351585 RepID=A0A498RFB6_9FIRM|nr:XdhC/CoxI family protein [Lucifera butyrica]VBB08792.1 xdhc- coxi [Lucifera butyrica]VBB08797.1 xdhc- coxi [Lucifera butyrica]
MNKLFREMTGLLEMGESFVVATIFDKSGSAPRTAGTKMVVRPDGSILGTIGGGRLEAAAIKLAQEAMGSRRTMLQSFDLTGEDVAGMDMICGGKGEILLDYIDAGDENNRIIAEQIVKTLDRREKAWLITVLNNNGTDSYLSRQQCLVKADGILVGKVDADPYLLAKLITGPAKISIHAEVLANQRILVEPVRYGGIVYIFGAGHVSQKIAPLAETVGFKTVVLDDRDEYANRKRFTGPTEIILLAAYERLPELAVDEDSYIVIVTRGHLYDKTVLEQVLRTRAGYIGMIGSRRKRDKIFEALLAQGWTRQDLDRVYSPIGMAIDAETPEELAVSIVGELIKVRAERENGAKKENNGSDTCCRLFVPDGEI